MNAKEFGEKNAETVILLHGGGLSWWNYREAAELLQRRYHVVLPILDGHAGSDRRFTSIEDNAEEICASIDAAFHGRVLAIGGLSLGAQVALEMLSRRPDICRFALIESALALPMPLTNRLTPWAIGMSYGLIRKRWFARLQFNALRMKGELFEDYYRDSSGISKTDYIAFLQSNSSWEPKETLSGTKAKVLITVGGKEQKNMLASADRLRRVIPNSEASVLPGYYHGDLSINHAEEYVQLLTELIST